MTTLFNRAYIEIGRRLQRDEGQTLVEYALIGVFVAIACVVALTALGKGVGTQLTNITNKL
jgi:Flp pilus assembly pilin Flp